MVAAVDEESRFWARRGKVQIGRRREARGVVHHHGGARSRLLDVAGGAAGDCCYHHRRGHFSDSAVPDVDHEKVTYIVEREPGGIREPGGRDINAIGSARGSSRGRSYECCARRAVGYGHHRPELATSDFMVALVSNEQSGAVYREALQSVELVRGAIGQRGIHEALSGPVGNGDGARGDSDGLDFVVAAVRDE